MANYREVAKIRKKINYNLENPYISLTNEEIKTYANHCLRGGVASMRFIYADTQSHCKWICKDLFLKYLIIIRDTISLKDALKEYKVWVTQMGISQSAILNGREVLCDSESKTFIERIYPNLSEYDFKQDYGIKFLKK